MIRPLPPLRRTLLTLLAFGGLSCVDGPTGPRTGGVATVTPEAVSLLPLDTARLTVRVGFPDGSELTAPELEWTSLDTLVARVDASGLVTASLYTGAEVRSTAIRVAHPRATPDTVPVEVRPWPVHRVLAAADTVLLLPGDSTLVNVLTESEGGVALEGREVLWLSSDTAALQVQANGRLLARPYAGPLLRTVFASSWSEGVADSVVVRILPLPTASLSVAPDVVTLRPGQLDTLSAEARSVSNVLLVDAPMTWTSSDTAVVRVNGEGVLTASFYIGAAARSASIIASTGDVADTVLVQVEPLDAASVAIAPDSGMMLPGQTLQLDATVRDAAGSFLEQRPLAWHSTDTTIARVSATGLVTAQPSGRADTVTLRIVVSTAAVADSVTIVVAPHPVAWIVATPEALALVPGDTGSVSLVLSALDLTPLSGRSVAWTSLDPSVATVDGAGRVTATAYTGPTARSTNLVATSGAAADTVPVSVAPFAVERVIASPTTLDLSPGDSAQLSVATETLAGLALTDRLRLWLSSDTSVVRVDSTGLVVAVPYTGAVDREAAVVVYSEGLADTVAVTVQALPPVSITLTPDSVLLTPGQQTTIASAVHAAGGIALEGVPLSWVSTDTTVARVNAEGIVTASFYVGADSRSAQVIAASGALADTATIAVAALDVASVQLVAPDTLLAPGAALQLDATVRDAEGLFLTGRVIAWSTLEPTVATVSASGLVTAVPYGGPDTGTVRIVAAVAGVADTLRLTRVPHAVAWATAMPENLALLPLDTARVTVALASINLDPLTDRPLAWQATDPSVASVDASGLVTAAAYTGPTLRSAAIVVTSGAAADTIPVSVSPLAVDHVVAATASITLASGDSATLTASARAADSTVLSGRELLWLSSDTSLVTVSADGIAVAQPNTTAADTVTSLVVYSEGKADTVLVTVTAIPPAALVLAPDSLSIIPGEVSALTATVLAAGGIPLSGHVVTWTSLDTAIARVNVEGAVTGTFYVGADERVTAVVATTGAVADTALVRVRALLPDSIAIFPDTQTLKPNRTAQLSAVVRDSSGLFLEGRTIVWTTSDPTIATVDDTGLVTTHRAGIATITATSGGATDTATVTIVHPVTAVDVTPGLSTLWIGRTQTFVAALRDSVDAPLTDRAVLWTSSNPSRASVDSTGLVTALSPGLVYIVASAEGVADSASVDVFAEPTAAITITFDDSWRGVLTYAAPMMDSLRLRANVGWITSVDWSGVMTPPELRELQARGWSILSHSMTHPRLTELTGDSAAFELAGSRARVDSLGFDPRVFIVPYLDHNDAVLAASAAAGYTYTRCCAQDTWSSDTLLQWPIAAESRHRLTGVDVTDYDGQTTTYNFRTAGGRAALAQLLADVVAAGKFVDVFFHDIVEADVPDLKLTLEILAGFRPYLITYAMLP